MDDSKVDEKDKQKQPNADRDNIMSYKTIHSNLPPERQSTNFPGCTATNIQPAENEKQKIR